MRSTTGVSASRPGQQPKLLDVLVVGGGLSGLLVCQGLQRMQADWRLLEARPVLGGRLMNDLHLNSIDLGGAWLWPQHQPRIRTFLAANKHSIQTFAQPDDPSSTRVQGGAVRLIESIVNELEEKKDKEEPRILLDTPVTHCQLLADQPGVVRDSAAAETTRDSKVVQVRTGDGKKFHARKVVFAVPPKLIEKHISFDPPLSETKRIAMAASHTWMAGVTKVALVYPKRFWDLDYSNSGFPSGTVPAFQVYDSSTSDGTISALTFFALVPQGPALNDDVVLAKQVAEQMAKLWNYLRQPDMSKQVHSYTSYHVQRWPTEPYISENDRPTMIHPHPVPVTALSRPEWNRALHFAGSETDRHSPGVMEGAFGAAERVLLALDDDLTKKVSNVDL